MPYSTAAQVVARYGAGQIQQLTDRSGSGDVDYDVIDLAIASADSSINAYVAKQHVLPLADTPPLLADLSVRLTYCILHESLPAVPEQITAEKKGIMALLGDIGSGKASLGLTADGGGEQSGSGNIVVDKPDADVLPLARGATGDWQ